MIGLGLQTLSLSLTRPTGPGLAQQVSNLFAQGEQGFWFDPTDNSTLFQDLGATTVDSGTVEVPIGMILDRTKPLVESADKVSGILSSSDNWTLDAAGSVSGNALSINTPINTASTQYYTPPVAGTFAANKFYVVRFTVTRTKGTLYIRVGSGPAYNSPDITASGTYKYILVCGGGTSNRISFNSSASSVNNFVGSITNISVTLLDGNHAYQATSASRPTLRARYNLLTYSEKFENAAWTKSSVTIAQNSVVGPTGAQTADTATASGANGTVRQALTLLATPYTLSVWIKRKTGTANIDLSVDGTTWTTKTITTDWARYSVTQTPTAGANNPGLRIVTSGDEVYLWGAQLNYGSTATTYQSIDGATVYATGPDFPQYLDFDGADDSLLTASINFSGTDEMSVFAGVTKTSDAAQGMVAELTATTASNNGSWSLQAPDAAAAATYLFQSKGTSLTDAQKTSVAAVNTSILSGLSDISADTTKLRVNGVQAEEDTGDQGTGNFSNSIVYIGRRNNNTLPFKGRIYGLIVRGKTCDSSQIEAAERLLAVPAQVTL